MFKLIALAFACIYLINASLAFPKNGSNRVVGGLTANVAQFPYQVAIKNRGIHICGGTIFSQRHIITAAHCVSGVNVNSLSVLAGTNNIKEGGTSYAVYGYTIHENYDYKNIVHDIAVIKLKDKMIFTDLQKPIPLASKSIGSNEDCILSGWGRVNYPGESPNELQFINLKTYDLEQCKVMHAPQNIYDTEICTFTQAGEGACQGDSGGPLVANGELIGVVSWGKPCATGRPDIFTRVYSYLNWVKIHTH